MARIEFSISIAHGWFTTIGLFNQELVGRRSGEMRQENASHCTPHDKAAPMALKSESLRTQAFCVCQQPFPLSEYLVIAAQ